METKQINDNAELIYSKRIGIAHDLVKWLDRNAPNDESKEVIKDAIIFLKGAKEVLQEEGL